MTTRLKPLLTLATLTLLALPGIAQATGCPNEEFRTGSSASLPDCRAYELVTPEELGRTQAITFSVADHAIPSIDGERLALETLAPLEPDPDTAGTRAVFSRTAQGWTATSLVPPEFGGLELDMIAGSGTMSPDLAQVAFTSEVPLNQEERHNSPWRYEAGPVGGPYALVAEAPITAGGANFAGANAGTPSVPAFTDVLVESEDHQLLPEGPERTIAKETLPGAHTKGYDLYDWTGGALRLVNVEGKGADVKMLNPCGDGELGGGGAPSGAGAVGAVSADGSTIFFTSCGRLYMRVNGRETVEVSAPQGIEPSASERSGVSFNVASADGSEVVFNTATPLLPGETTSGNKLFIYDTVTRDLRLIGEGVPAGEVGTGRDRVLISEDGSAVYYDAGESIYRYETQTGMTSFVATTTTPAGGREPSYTTPNGRFLVFVSGNGGVKVAGSHGLELEPRGVGHNELYRYDVADGSVMCVSCGEGIAPAEGAMHLRTTESDVGFETYDEMPPFIQMSEDGQRVFFQTTAQLVPQDTNSTEEEGSSVGGFPGMDVYEWEADGVEEAPGVVCRVVNGCTHLLSSGEDVGQATFLGASENGSNVFFATAARMVPQATPEFPNIYDARVDGGFAPPREVHPCLSCQGVGSTAPLFGPGASLTFAGPGDPTALASTTSTVVATKTVKCGKGYVRSKGRCVKSRRRKKVKRASRGAKR